MKSPDEFNLDSSRTTGRQSRCKICHQAGSLKWKLSDKGREAGRRYTSSERGKEMARLRRQAKETSKQERD
jgi:hypothetical protein